MERQPTIRAGIPNGCFIPHTIKLHSFPNSLQGANRDKFLKEIQAQGKNF
jgi:hypothetical protein